MINITINTNTPNSTSLSGFYTAAFICRPPAGEFTPSRTSTVTSLQDCIDAGFDETTEVYEWLKVGLSQSPRMSQFIIRLMLDGESVSDALDAEHLNVLYLCIEDIDLVHKKQLADYVYGSGYLALISCVDDNTLDFADNPNVIYIHKAMYDENYIQLDSDEFPDESVATDTETTPTAQYPEAAWVSRFGSQQPASIEWLNKPLTAVMPPPTTPPASSNYYGVVYDTLVATGSGKTMSGEWIDQTVFLKWLEISLRSQIFSLLHDKAKVSFTVADKEMLLNKVRYVLSVGEKLGGISRKYEAYIVAEQREQRNIIIGFKAQLLNGINSVEDIQGTITA
jgi:hypothetical protein